MDTKELKNYIFDNNYVEQLLDSIGCHHIIFHSSGQYWTCANTTGDNKNAIVIYNTEFLPCINYTRQMIKSNRNTDIIDLICYTKDLSFPDAIKYICNEIGISYYYDFNEDMPESFRILDLLNNMNSNCIVEKEVPLKPISEKILSYYRPYVNQIFFDDNIDYQTQKEFEIGYDEFSNRYTIPVRSEIGDLIGVKGRYFYRDVPDGESKYIYLEPCARSKILYGLNKTLNFIKQTGRVYILESEKAVMQLWSYGFRNCVATGGKNISQSQIEMLVRLGVDIVLCFDKDVDKTEIDNISNKFPDVIPIYYIYDEDNILEDHESPSDNPNKWNILVNKNLYRIK